MSTTVHTACFVVTGEALTEMARALLLDDEPGKAYRLLADGLHGDGAIEAAISVLRGTHDLVGDSSSGLDLVEAEDTEELRRFQADFRYIYAGRYRSGRRWVRPVARIVGWGTADGKWATAQTQADGVGGMREWSKHRANFYCGPDEEPHLLKLKGDDSEDGWYIVFEACGEPPHWMRPNNTAQEALDDALAAGRKLSKRKPPPADPEDKPAKRVRSRPSKAELRLQDEEAEQREVKRQQRLQQIGHDVRAQAGDDTFDLTLADGRTLTIPRAPFVRWALHRTPESDAAPDWKNVAPSGVKLLNDNPDHTDWVLGAGLTLKEAYKAEISDPVWNAAFRFQEEARDAKTQPRPYSGIFSALEQLRDASHEAAIIVDAGERTGVVGEDIAVFPDSSGERAKQIGDARGVIVEQGGELAHFAVVSRGLGITVMRCPDACETFPAGTRVTLSPSRGRIIISEDE